MDQSIRTITLLPRCFVNAWQLSRESLQTKLVLVDPPPHTSPRQRREHNRKRKVLSTLTYPTQTKLAHHTTSTTSSRTTIFDSRRSRVATEGVQLELRLVAHLGGETVVACDVEVCAARYLVVGNALSRFDVAEDACIWSRRHSGGNV